MSRKKPSTPGPQTPYQKLKALFLLPVFGIDTRSLALFRVAVATIILVDLWVRCGDITMFYTNEGVLPTDLLVSKYNSTKVFWYNPHFYINTFAWQAFWFCVAALLAVMLLVGYRSRWVAFASWFLLLSLHNRNPMVLQSGDTLLRMLVFWAMFLPIGAHFSVDRALDPTEKEPPRAVVNPLTAGLLLQMFCLYFFTGILKKGATWENGTALYYALNIDAWTRPFGSWMLQFHEMNALATHGTLYLELFGPFLPFLPLFTAQFRMLAITVFCSLHIGIALTMDVGLFSYISMAGWLPYLPTKFWDFLGARIGTWGQGLAMYYDGNCGFCKKGVLLGRSFLLLPKATIAPAHTRREILDLMEEKNSWVVVRNDEKFIEFDAVIAVFGSSVLTWWLVPLMRIGAVHALGTKAYRTVANNRKLFSKLTRPLFYRKQSWNTHGVVSLFALVCLLYVFAWNIRSTNFNEHKSWFPRKNNGFGYFLRLDQYWAMFAPDPTRVDGWFVIPAFLENGGQIDLYKNGEAVSFEKPKAVVYQHPTMRWRKYMMNLKVLKNAEHRDPFADYLCNAWNAKHPDNKIKRLQVIFMREDTPNPKETEPVYPRKIFLKNYTCGNYRR
ncbi:DCC1-like thiol-disulfide oxidoreductase family protein [Acanthopleuribacter pedis]|uniref:HTTM domain-containing protein n=1 Tax=Acanthopleuribacter pedis TaxID=442870 RepID=A0A8J7QEU8_9BACT|nr:HTTM domain-containing protein [Acanthopleuribacter pedis]MBO1318470.1 HTTM domain-containing protein [Acanthopleuribacter pedis]